jgi:hypothetical protein
VGVQKRESGGGGEATFVIEYFSMNKLMSRIILGYFVVM